MIRVTVELLPRGDASNPQHLGTAYITNEGTGDRNIGDYSVKLSKWGKPDVTWKTGSLTGFPRLKLGPWDLLCLCLIATLGNRITSWKDATVKSKVK